jgi:phosphatidylserine decarboxylase
MSTFKDTFKRVCVPIHREGYNIILIAFVIALLFSMASDFLGYLAFILFGFCVFFFRDPFRIVPDNSNNLVIASADGVVDFIGVATPPKELNLDKKEKWTRVSIFLSVFNVHIQRIPTSGTITQLHYREGKFVNVAIDKYSQDNERQSCVVETKSGIKIPFVQIAGLIARRIICDLKKGQKVKTGEKYGIIRFGSRVDVYLPEGINPKVKVGQTMVAGESIIAELPKTKTKTLAKKSVVKKVVKKKTETTKKIAKKTTKK